MIQIIAPHLDDAILSLGGAMNNWINIEKKKVSVLYLFSISDWTNPLSISGLSYPKDKEKVSEIRKLEEKNVNSNLNYEYKMLDYFDMPIRDKSNDSQLKEDIKAYIIDNLDFNYEMYFPLATGEGHIDHKLTKKIGLELISEGHNNIRFYEDLPYTGFEDSHQKMKKQIEALGLVAKLEEIDMDAKFKLVKMYESQISSDWECASRSYNYSIVDDKYYERYWVMK